MDDDSGKRSYRLMLAAIIGTVVVLVAVTAAVAAGAIYSTQQNAKARSACIQAGGAWVQGSCVGIK